MGVYDSVECALYSSRLDTAGGVSPDAPGTNAVQLTIPMNNLLVLLLAALPASRLAPTASVAGQARAGIAHDRVILNGFARPTARHR